MTQFNLTRPTNLFGLAKPGPLPNLTLGQPYKLPGLCTQLLCKTTFFKKNCTAKIYNCAINQK